MRTILALALIALLATGCGVPQEKFDALQKELGAEREAGASLKTQLALATNQVAVLQAQIATTETKLAAAKEESVKRITELENRLASTSAKVEELAPLAKQALTLPVTITMRKALLGSGRVYQFRNTSSEDLPVTIRLSNPSFTAAKTFDRVLDSNGKNTATEIGHLEGWTGAPGDVIQIRSGGYDLMVKTFE